MTGAMNFPMTHQGVRDLDNPIRPRPQHAEDSHVNVGRTERGLSGVGGAVLAGYGLSRGGLLGWTLAAIGGSLVFRGATGHCYAYQAAGVSTARKERT